MQITTRKVADLSLDPANVRTHDERNLAAIRASLLRFGQQEPIVVDAKGMVVAGNGRLTVARELGWETIEVVESDLDALGLTAFGIASNRTAELAGWDTDALAAVLRVLAAEDGPTLEATGFDASALAQALTQPDADGNPTTQPDGSPIPPPVEIVEDEIPEKVDPVTKPGDLWLLGAYFECEDCGKRFDYEEGNAMGGECDCE